MKYSMVKQFSNSALDNIFKFIFRWVDFGKVMLDAGLSFLSIWQAFFAIFYNIFMYFYYLVLFFIDRGSEEGIGSKVLKRPVSVQRTSLPALDFKSTAPPPAPRIASVAQAVTETAASAVSSIPAPQKSSGGGQKKNILKSIGEPIVAFFLAITGVFKKLGIFISEFLRNRIKPVKEEGEKTSSGKGSLIDEYLREYERQRK